MPSKINNRPVKVEPPPPKLPPQFWAKVYQNHRNNFIYRATRKFHCTQAEAKDIFQEMVLALYYRYLAGKPIPTDGALKAYLFVVGSNILKTRFKRLRIHQKAINHLTHQQASTTANAFNFEVTEQWTDVQKEIDKLGCNAEKLIELVFFKGYCQEAVARELNYKNTNVVKMRKNTILNTLKSILINTN